LKCVLYYSASLQSINNQYHPEIYVCVCVCVCMYIYVCVCVYMCVYVCMYIYMCVCVYMCVYVCMYIYRLSQEECARLREGVPYAKVPKTPMSKVEQLWR